MKTLCEWNKWITENRAGRFSPGNLDEELLSEIQRDATEEWKQEVRRLNHNVEVYKERWCQARRYLRQANKGAERNNMVMRLQAADIGRLLERIKQLEQRP